MPHLIPIAVAIIALGFGTQAAYTFNQEKPTRIVSWGPGTAHLAEVSDSDWLLVDGGHDTSAITCDWLKSQQIKGIDSTEDYEITTEEFCDL